MRATPRAAAERLARFEADAADTNRLDPCIAARVKIARAHQVAIPFLPWFHSALGEEEALYLTWEGGRRLVTVPPLPEGSFYDFL